MQEGKQETYDLGKFLRRRYNNLVGDEYSSEIVYIRSSDTDRALMSAQCAAAGLFPPSGNEIWNTNLMWQPVSVHTIAFDEDIHLNSRVECPFSAYDYYRDVFSPEQQYLLEKYRSLLEFIEQNSGLKMEYSKNVMSIYKLLVAQRRRGLV